MGDVNSGAHAIPFTTEEGAMNCFGYGPSVALLACTLAVGTGQASAQEPAGDQATRRPTRLQGGAGIVGAAAIGQFGMFVPDGAGGLLAHLSIGIRDTLSQGSWFATSASRARTLSISILESRSADRSTR